MILYVLAANLPCILVQRYSHIMILRHIKRTGDSFP